MTTHRDEHARVKRAVRQVIIAFAVDRLTWKPSFHMQELTYYVSRYVPTAPDSAGRILRALRQDHVIDYRLVSRAASEYEIVAVNGGELKQLRLV